MKDPKHHGREWVDRFGYHIEAPTYQFKPTGKEIVHEDGTVTRDGKRYGCSVDLEEGEEPMGCDLTCGHEFDCTFMHLSSGQRWRSMFTCKNWKVIEDGK